MIMIAATTSYDYSILSLAQTGSRSSFPRPSSFTSKRAAKLEQTKELQRVLVVDDDKDVLFTLKAILETGPFTVDTISSPVQALANYVPSKYDLMILDVKMPKMNGFELYEEIMKVNSTQKVCFLTAGETYIEEFRKLFPHLSRDHYLLKPVDTAELFNRIRKILK